MTNLCGDQCNKGENYYGFEEVGPLGWMYLAQSILYQINADTVCPILINLANVRKPGK